MIVGIATEKIISLGKRPTDQDVLAETNFAIEIIRTRVLPSRGKSGILISAWLNAPSRASLITRKLGKPYMNIPNVLLSKLSLMSSISLPQSSGISLESREELGSYHQQRTKLQTGNQPSTLNELWKMDTISK